MMEVKHPGFTQYSHILPVDVNCKRTHMPFGELIFHSEVDINHPTLPSPPTQAPLIFMSTFDAPLPPSWLVSNITTQAVT